MRFFMINIHDAIKQLEENNPEIASAVKRAADIHTVVMNTPQQQRQFRHNGTLRA